VFSTSTPFSTQGTYTKFGAYAVLYHQGDFKKAAQALAEKGFGTWIDERGEEHPNPRPKGAGKRKPAVSGSAGNPAGGSTQALDNRPVIIVTARHDIMADQALKALARDQDLFCRGAVLGIVVEEKNAAVKLAGGVELANVKGSARFLVLSRKRIGCYLAKNAEFHSWSKDRNKEDVCKVVGPPARLVETVETWGHFPQFRALLSIASAPYVRSDGSIPDPGYDPSTGTFYRRSVKLPDLPLSPTRQDAVDAAQRLHRVVGQFPFEDDDDWLVWLAAVLTAVQRPVIAGPVPGIALNANRAGTGKGLLIDAAGIIAWGHGIPTRSYPDDKEEARKVKLSVALAGVSAVHFDNLDEGRWYGGGDVDSALTSTVVEDRILGGSRESGPVPLRPVWFLSGNNIVPGRDAFRRWLPINFVTELETPHERDDITIPDLKQYVTEHRGELLRDALVILRAHALEGRPVNWKGRLGSFEEWDQIVRGAVWFATERDCLATQRKATADSPERAVKLALLQAWFDLPGGGPGGDGVTAGEARELAEHIPAAKGQPMISTRHPELREALLDLSSDSKLPSSRKIGDKIRAMQRQNIAGLRFEKSGTKHQAVRWRVSKSSKGSRGSQGSQGSLFQPFAENSGMGNHVLSGSQDNQSTGANGLPRLPDSPPASEQAEVRKRIQFLMASLAHTLTDGAMSWPEIVGLYTEARREKLDLGELRIAGETLCIITTDQDGEEIWALQGHQNRNPREGWAKIGQAFLSGEPVPKESWPTGDDEYAEQERAAIQGEGDGLAFDRGGGDCGPGS